MSTSSPHFFRLFVILFIFIAADIHAKNNFAFTNKACNLAQKGHSVLKPYLEVEENDLYADETQFIKKFPFSLYELTTVPSQGKFYINDIDDTIKNHLRRRLCWEPKNQAIISKYVKPGTIALDIGAHIGTHTVTMAKCVGRNGAVYAFEPSRNTYRELVYNLVANNCRNTYPIRAAIGKTKAVVDIIVSHPRNEGGSYVINTQGGSDRAILMALDDLNLNNISFIKIDVENMEADVLDGAALTILRNKPVMLIEIQGNGQRPEQLGEDTEEMARISIEKVKMLGYRLIQLENSPDYLAFPKN
jgi:FkbM family methyltransferase